MSYLLFFIVLVLEISTEGVLATVLGLASAIGVDIITALITGAGLMSVFRGPGLVDDIVMMMLHIKWNVRTKLYASIFIDQAMHAGEEAYEHYSHTDYQNRRYAAYLARKTPGVTYVYGDVTHVDLLELGYSGYKLYQTKTFKSVFEALKGKLEGLVPEEVTSDAMAMWIPIPW